MKRTIWTGTCTAVVGFATAAIFAQTPAPQQSSTTQQPSTASSSERKVTVTGCLKAASGDTAGAAATGTTGTTAGTTAGTTGTSAGTPTAAGAEATYVLADAVESSASATSPSSTSDPTSAGTTAATAPASGPRQTYRLIANPAALTPHVGKKLELTGTLENQSSAAAPSETTTAASHAQGPALHVESGKVIAASCSEQ